MSKQETITRERFNYLKKYYDNSWDEKKHTLHVGLFKNNNDSLEKSYSQATQYLIKNMSSIKPIDQDSNILDIGCGTGRTLISICVKFDCQGIGVDLSDEQIKDAEIYLNKSNIQRAKEGKTNIRVKFIRSSGSSLNKAFGEDSQFTHIISQDALLFIENKQSLFQNIYRLLTPGGVFAAADFLSESEAKNRTTKEEDLIYKLVNWNKGLSFEQYNQILKTVGLTISHSERRDPDMILTYQKLAQKMNQHQKSKEKTYLELKERYENIAQSTKDGKMGWAFFFAQKLPRKTALIAGTKEKSIGRFLAEHLHKNGWEIWLYSRKAKKIDKSLWHERKCDISDEKSLAKLLTEIKNINLVMMLADGGESHLVLEELSEESIKTFINAKLIGSLLLTKALALKFPKPQEPIQLAWCGGKISQKPKDLILYGIINSSLVSFMNELRDHYSEIFEAYYLPTPIVSPSTIGDAYIQKMGTEFQKISQKPKIISDAVDKIINRKLNPGIVEIKASIL
ncbi:MAG: methyltransferase domain-containing protein [Parcubacteria group bacterium]|jgi:cyclopropane fatty-acyl-phospholipid synthase-like methyltransferase/short-subunit dehydrogenase